MLSEKKFKVKIVKNKFAKEKLDIDKKPTVTFGLYHKDKLIGICAYYPVTKKEWKVWRKISKRFSKEQTFQYKKKISKKFSKDENIQNLFNRKKHFICIKKYPEIINVSQIS